MTHVPNIHLNIATSIGPAKVYLVGGYVRDLLLGLQPKDRDFLVVGATHDLMVEYGFTQVGADFPVYLHPTTGDEYALARTERKTGPGYQGFTTDSSPDVTVEEDLLRRDLTINSMAIDLQGFNRLIDPYGGQKDLGRAMLRHTSEAFKEDPVRIIRSARFAARYNFYVHKTTRDFMQDMVLAGAMEELIPERVWGEMSRGLMEKNPFRMFQVLSDCQALRHMRAPWHGGLYASGLWTFGGSVSHFTLPQRFALIAEYFNAPDYDINKIPTDCSKMATLLKRWKHVIPTYDALEPMDKLLLLSQIGAIGTHRTTPLYAEFVGTFLAWGDTRFKTFLIPQLDTMSQHAKEINLLTPPEGLAGKAIAEYMLNARIGIVR